MTAANVDEPQGPNGRNVEMSKAKTFWSKQGKNFMTPNIIEYRDTSRFLVELSQGRGFDQEPIFGVTIATLGGERDYDRSKMFYDLDKAKAYIDTLEIA